MSQQTRPADHGTVATATYADQGLDRLEGSRPATSSSKTMTREIRLSAGLLALTAVAMSLFVRDALGGVVHLVEARDLRAIVEQAVLVVVLAFLIFGNVVYQVARIGYLRRKTRHLPAPADDLARFGAAGLPSLVTLVPSYREERQVVAQTLLSAALQRYPSRVVLLIDDPPSPASEEHRNALEAMRLLPAEIEARLAAPADRIRAHRERFEHRIAARGSDPAAATLDLADLWDEVARWFDDETRQWPVADHTDAFFVEHMLRRPGQEAASRAAELRRTGPTRGLDQAGIARDLTTLANMFASQLTSFERKRYVNLSREPNKAMNLNTYIDLLGRSLREVDGPDGVRLLPAGDGRADLVVPPAQYVMTLDADSLLSPDYALRLVYELERPTNERVAVIQTPYCAVPGTQSALERTAGATTDIQHIFHQGSTSFGATSWVGANAVLRRRALDDIRSVEDERGFPVARYIQDRTVIEDTESSIDLIAAGWLLHNYPDRLAVSATPPDFGALVIQRRRWANGGLIILPKLFRYLVRRPSRKKLAEGAVRFHYLSSIAGANVGLFILLSYPFEKTLSSPWLPVTALPYFLLYARDLRHVGYRKRTVVGVYALNLALVPINLAGVAKSLHQAVTGKKVPFARTPKVAGRTRVPAGYIAAEFLILVYWSAGAAFDVAARRWWHAGFGAANIALLAYALAFFVGLRQAGADLVAPLERARRRERRAEASSVLGPRHT